MSNPDDRCASCGNGGNGLKSCAACKLAKYCNASCQKAHYPEHKTDCKRRVAELHDEALFRQPPPNDDCPICFLPLPRPEDTRYKPCCGKLICTGCQYALEDGNNDVLCAFCRLPDATSHEEMVDRIKKRLDKNDACAYHLMGCVYDDGDPGFPVDTGRAIEMWLRAVELGPSSGSTLAHDSLAIAYGQRKDRKRFIHHLEHAAMGGVNISRWILGKEEWKLGNMERGIKHLAIAARAGHKDSARRQLQFTDSRGLQGSGLVTREQYGMVQFYAPIRQPWIA